MGPSEPGAGPTRPDLPIVPQPPAPDIDIVPFKGSLPLSRGAPERRLQRTDRYDRRAEVIAYEPLTSTGTVLISFRVIDDQPFLFAPGYFVGIQAAVGEFGLRRSPYCISSVPNDDRTFRLLVRLVPEGPLSVYLAALDVGDVIKFRGPSGRSMIPKEDGTELILLATGVGVGPYLSLLPYLLPQAGDRPVRLYWGLRQIEDLCLVDELDEIARRFDNFTYEVSLSQPPARWPGLRGRLTESVPPLLATLGAKHYYLVGNGAMIEELMSVISDLGVNKQFIYHESYFNVRYRPHPDDLAAIRARFVASDLFSPYRHQEKGLFMPEVPVSRRGPRGEHQVPAARRSSRRPS